MKKISIVSALALVAASASSYTLDFNTNGTQDMKSVQSNRNRGLNSKNDFGALRGDMGNFGQGDMKSDTRGNADWNSSFRELSGASKSPISNAAGSSNVSGTLLGGTMAPSMTMMPMATASQAGTNMSSMYGGDVSGSSVLGSQFNVGANNKMSENELMRSGNYDSSNYQMRDMIQKPVTTTTTTTETSASEG